MSWMARLLITSLTFMLVCVPLPVCHTTRGKWASSSRRPPSRRRMFLDRSESSFPKARLWTRSGFTIPMLLTTGTGILSPILKLSLDLWVWAPHSTSAGTWTDPMVSDSSRNSWPSLCAGNYRLHVRHNAKFRHCNIVIVLTSRSAVFTEEEEEKGKKVLLTRWPANIYK